MVQKLWDFCDVLRDDGLSYGDYLEQLTYLLFLKMADEQYEMLGGGRIVPVEHDWQSLLNRSGADLEAHYSDALAALGAGEDMLGVVFHKARNRIQTPAKLEQLIKEFIDQHEWMSYDADLKGDAYEGLIEKTAQEGARGAGQYFTPRALINAIVDVMQPDPTTASVTPPVAPAVSSWARTGRSSSGSRIWNPTRSLTCARVRSLVGRSPTSRPGCAP